MAALGEKAKPKTKSKSKSKSMRLKPHSNMHRRLVEYFVVVSSVPQNNPSDGITVTKDYSASPSKSTSSVTNLEEEIEKQLSFEAVITSRYPVKDHEMNPLLHESVVSFCHPSEEIKLKHEFCMPKIHYFVSTGGRGAQIYGVCLTMYEPLTVKVNYPDGTSNDEEVFCPKCICILSAYPYLVAFREYLTQLERLSKSGEMKVPVERFISNFCSEVAAPLPGSFEVQTSIGNSLIKIWSPPDNQPIAWISLPFAHLFQCLEIKNIILVWHALALERQILLVSTQKTLLTTCSEILVSLLFPMKWSHAYIPLLPKFLISILSAPMPYFCGIDKIYLNDAIHHLNDECIIVDLDCNHVMMGPSTPNLPPIPKEFEKKLFSKLNLNAGMVFREARSLAKDHDFSDRGEHLPPHVKATADAVWESKLCLCDEAFHLSFTSERDNEVLNGNDDLERQSRWDAVQEAFMTVYVSLLCSYRHCLVFPSKDGQSSNDVGSTGSYGGAGFRSKEFIRIQKFERRNFLKELINTQMFDEFVTKRLYGSGASDVAFFDRAIDSFLKVHRFSMDRSYHSESNHHEKENDARPSSAPSNSMRSINSLRSVNSMRKLFDRVRPHEQTKEEFVPLICSARVHKKLKTIVPPEPSSENILNDKNDGKNDSDEVSLLSMDSKETHDTALSSPMSSFGNSVNDENDELEKFQYTIFPSKLDKKLFGKPRPLPAAVLAEFERQKDSAAQFRKRGKKVKNFDRLKSPEETTFTVFFMVLTNIIGRDLQKLSSNKHSILDQTILEPQNIGHFAYGDSDSESNVPEARNLNSEFLKTMPSSTSSMSLPTTDSSPRNRFRDPIYFSKLEEAKASASAQLDLAFEMLDIMKGRQLTARSVVYKCLIDACGRCGDTDRATKLVNRMHDDGIVADGVVYSCLVAAFSAESSWRRVSGNTDLPEWANGASVELDWNKVGKPSTSTLQNMMKKLRIVSSNDGDTSNDNDIVKENKVPSPTHWVDEPLTPEKFVTDTVGNHIGFGENLLEIVYPDISIDTDDERCPSCNSLLLDDMVVSGWTPGNSQDYTTTCPICSTKFVPTFRVQCTSQSFLGSRGHGTPLICERLSPWVLEKELRIKMADWDGINDLLDSTWREKETKNAILWWNLILAFMRYRIPFTFLLQGNFGKNLIIPMPQNSED